MCLPSSNELLVIAVRPHNAGRVWFPWQAIYLRVWITEPEMGGRKVVTLSWGQHCSTETKCLWMENGTRLCPSGSSPCTSQVKGYLKKWIKVLSFSRWRVNCGPLSFISLHGCSFCLFFLLFLFLLQVLKCHPLVLSSYSEGVCRGRGADGSRGGGRLWINCLRCLAGGHFYHKVEVISDADMNETWVDPLEWLLVTLYV